MSSLFKSFASSLLALSVVGIAHADDKAPQPKKPSASDFMVSMSQSADKDDLKIKTIDGSLSYCSSIKHAKERLTCYENIARDEGFEIKAVDADDKDNRDDAVYQWNKKVDTDFNGKPIIVTGIETNKVVDSLNPTDENPPHSYLNMRCRKGSLDLYVSYDKAYISKVPTVNGQTAYPTTPFNVDVDVGGQKKTYPFVSGSTGHSLGLWGSDNSGQLIEYISGFGQDATHKNDLITTMVDLGDGHKITSTFSMVGMNDNLPGLIRDCYMNK